MAKGEHGPDIGKNGGGKNVSAPDLLFRCALAAAGGKVVSVHRGPKKNERMADE